MRYKEEGKMGDNMNMIPTSHKRLAIWAVLIASVLGITTNAEAYLHPQTGRFVQRDPIGYADGMSLYEYVRSRPVSYVDPTGRLTAWVLHTGQDRSAPGGFAPTTKSKVMGRVWWKLGSKGPITVSVDGKKVATISTKKATQHRSNVPSQRCSKTFEWDWDWLKRAKTYLGHSGTIKYTMGGETISAKYTAKRKTLDALTGQFSWVPVPNAALSDFWLRVKGDYVTFSLGKPLKVVGPSGTSGNGPSVWEENVIVRVKWKYAHGISGRLLINKIDSEFGVSTPVSLAMLKRRSVTRPRRPRNDLQQDRNATPWDRPKTIPGRVIMEAHHGTANIYFPRNRSYWCHGALQTRPPMGASN